MAAEPATAPMQTRPSFASRLPTFSPGGSKIPTPTGGTPNPSRPQTPLQTAPSYTSPTSTGAPTPPSPSVQQPYFVMPTAFAMERRCSSSSLYSEDSRVKASYEMKSQDAIVVAVRMRPLSEKEWMRGDRESWMVDEDNTVSLTSPGNRTSGTKFNYDIVFRPDASNQQVYDAVGRSIVRASIQGINGTIFAYGVTSSGKTHTIMGIPQDAGIVPRAIRDLFGQIDSTPSKMFRLKFSMMEIYNEVVNDLLDTRNSNLRIREDRRRQATVDGLSEVLVESAEQALLLIAQGDINRKTGATAYNDDSSRSHTICRFTIESSDRGTPDGRPMRRSMSALCIIDLAGSEGARAATTKDQRMEGSFINKSLLTLGTVIGKLSDGGAPHIPFRDSKLTRLLQGSLSGTGAKVAIVANITPASSQAEETGNTLKFASRAKMIRITAQRNETVDEKALIRQYQRQIRELQQQVEEATAASRMASQISMASLANGMAPPDGYCERLMAEIDSLRAQVTANNAQFDAERNAFEVRMDRLTKLVLLANRHSGAGSVTSGNGFKRCNSDRVSETVSREASLAPPLPQPSLRRAGHRGSDASNSDALAENHLELRNPGWSAWTDAANSPSPRDYGLKTSNSIADRLGGIVSSVSGVDLHITLKPPFSTADAQDVERAQLREHLEVLSAELGDRTREIEALRAHRRSSLLNTADSSETSDRDVELQVLLADREILQDQLAVTEVDYERLLREMEIMQLQLAEAEEAKEKLVAENQLLKSQVPVLHTEVEQLKVQLEAQKAAQQAQHEELLIAQAAANALTRRGPVGRSVSANGSSDGHKTSERTLERSLTNTAASRLQILEEAVSSALGAVTAEVAAKEAARVRAEAAEAQLAACQAQQLASQEQLGELQQQLGLCQEQLARAHMDRATLAQQVTQLQERIGRLQGHLLEGLSAQELSELIGSLTHAVQRVKLAVEHRRSSPQQPQGQRPAGVMPAGFAPQTQAQQGVGPVAA